MSVAPDMLARPPRLEPSFIHPIVVPRRSSGITAFAGADMVLANVGQYLPNSGATKDGTIMSSQDHHVGLVVDRTFGERISELADSFHVWVVQSPINTPVIECVWKRQGIDPDVDPLNAGITRFEAMDDESANAIAERIASDIDRHHGAFAHDPPWSEIHVYGTPLSHELEEVFRERGATEFEPTKDGFISRR